ncbi:hypothetical protein O152_gp266 [Pseudomonas phage PaBG]|uniref:Uncharacterized protein n=1 Tax=Pseudomonas phage PaBG TaxID=1335230 RepID=S5VZP9_9CAUD|nr:hypothetical protein O152_gp266 [Pseudomonas phage PaBG]AGS82095.1 hypothetical protein PaBG_00220 [Pseudomonas phage PaBG]
MALIHINADGSFEAVAAGSSFDTAYKELKAKVTALKADIAAARKTVNPLKRIAGLKLQLQHAQPKRAAKIKEMINGLRTKFNLSPKATIGGTQRAVDKMETQLAKVEARIEKLREKNSNRLQPKTPAKKASQPTAKKAVTRKVSFDTEARRAARETTMGIKGKLRELDAKSKEPTKKKPAKATVKHPGSVSTGAKATVLATIKQIKADIAKGLTGPKLARAQAELKKQRAALRELRKGESAKNAAAVAPRAKASKAGMGSADKKPSSNEKRIESLRAKLKPLKPGSPEYRQIMTKIKTLQGRSPVGGNR